MVAPLDQAFHSNNSNVDKHINTKKLSIKTISTVSSLLPHIYKSHEAWRRKKSQTFSTENKVDNSPVKLQILCWEYSDILRWTSTVGYGYACVFEIKTWRVQMLKEPWTNSKEKRTQSKIAVKQKGHQ